jgi:hypothetical protein
MGMGAQRHTPRSVTVTIILIIIIIIPKGKVVHFYTMKAQKEKRAVATFILKTGITDNN